MQELNELKNLVIQTLQANGSLSNIRAQIRSSVFKVIDQPNSSKKVSPFHWQNVKCQKLHEEENGLNLLFAIKEFLQFYNMDYTNCVFASEANARTDVKRDQLIERLGLVGKVEGSKPVLMYLIERFKSGGVEGERERAVVKEEKVDEEILSRSEGEDMEGEELGESQGYDQSVDSSQLENYDYYEDVGKK